MVAVGDIVKGFKLLRLPVSSGSLVTRNLLVKQHSSRVASEKEEAERTVFLTHIDNFISEPQLAKSFEAFGEVEKVDITSKERKAPCQSQRADKAVIHVNFARVTFKHVDSIKNVMDAADGRIVSSALLPMPGGVLKHEAKAFKNLYKDAGELRAETDEWMSAYDARKVEEKRQAQENLVDDDGFTKVVSGVTRTSDGFSIKSVKRPGRKAGAFSEPMSGAQDGQPSKKDRRHKKKQEQERPDFYRFQQREKRREELIEHRKRKSQDEEKVEYMRKAKRFKAAKAAA